jgi:GNAT superfamily N-acetyltransferase
MLMIRQAIQKDISLLVPLINSAYRGKASKKGWTTEANLVSGDIRTDIKQMEELMNTPGAAFLVCESESGKPEGSVFLQKKENKLYLGMLSVLPELQAKGIGKKLMHAAEDYARQEHCISIYMRVISARHELIAWYAKLGYKNSGNTAPFESNKYGTAIRPLEFIIMEKMI